MSLASVIIGYYREQEAIHESRIALERLNNYCRNDEMTADSNTNTADSNHSRPTEVL